MNTIIFKIDSNDISYIYIDYTVEVITMGGLVAFPTETVYGLGANALNADAVRKIFHAKSRPIDNPLIVHIADIQELYKLARDVHKDVEKLVNKFWPGPLSVVLNKKDIVPDETTAFTETVAIRMPNHPIALELIKRSGVPIAAPSANLSGRPSPTKASHVIEDFNGKIDMIIDGGECTVGLESTVIDMRSKPYTILRPGGITFEQITEVLSDVRLFSSNKTESQVISPGMKYRHYAPEAELILAYDVITLLERFKSQGNKVGVLTTDETKGMYQDKADIVISVGSRNDLNAVARNIFDALREFDHVGVDVIISEIFPEEGIGRAIMNRLRKAANK
ncbi:MAG: L-threonylcarbamoyladenylate synthase [Candidatus Dojkabacteria bacterium]|nr:L-threonylcarbamoyladenylate synthase [Candidatus Dojkabacteria bacterium]